MKKNYIAPESEYIDFVTEDLVTAVMPPVQTYNDENPDVETGTQESDVGSPFD